MFDSLFNKALKAGVDKGVFEQPKGMLPTLFNLSPQQHETAGVVNGSNMS